MGKKLFLAVASAFGVGVYLHPPAALEDILSTRLVPCIAGYGVAVLGVCWLWPSSDSDVVDPKGKAVLITGKIFICSVSFRRF